MIAVGIVSTMTAVAIPSYRAVKVSSNESLAQHNLKQISDAFEQFYSFSGDFAYPESLTEVAGYVDPALVTGMRSGYVYQVDTSAEEAFAVLAIPQEPGNTGNRIFRISQGGGITELANLPKNLEDDYNALRWKDFNVKITGAEITDTSFSLYWKFTSTLTKKVDDVILAVRNMKFGGVAIGSGLVSEGLVAESSKKDAAKVNYYNVGTLKKGESATVKETFEKPTGGLKKGGWWYSRSFTLYEAKDKNAKSPAKK